MLLSNLFSIPGERCVDILITGEKISAVFDGRNSQPDTSYRPVIKFHDAIVFPGIINSHDHLDFNSFPQLGNKIYNNYVEWGEDIHQQNSDVINNVLKIPKQLKMEWGIYKNLLNGVTTVVNHGPKVSNKDDIITIWQNTYVLHSVRLENRWKYKLNMPFIKNHPFSIHIGEGTDKASREEIDELIKWNLFHRELIGIHSVAMSEEQADKFKGIVWCPDSNYFLLGRTAEINKLKHKAKILFGTDSTVSSNWNLWEHLRIARQEKVVTDYELFNMLNSTPADAWRMPHCGTLTKDSYANIVIGKRKQCITAMDSFFELNPEDILMVIHKGTIRLFDEKLYGQLDGQGLRLKNFSKIKINDAYKYVSGNLPKLIKSIKDYYPDCYFPITED